jgi:hypothetical protein
MITLARQHNTSYRTSVNLSTPYTRKTNALKLLSDPTRLRSRSLRLTTSVRKCDKVCLRVTIILTEAEHEEIKGKAGLIPLSRWIKSMVLGGRGNESGSQDRAMVQPERAGSSGERGAGAVKRVGKPCCVHGVEKGVNCWQCGGAAKA